jgi:polycomb group RING finger protein 3
LCVDEIKREREFYRVRGLPCPTDIPPNAGELEEEKSAPDQHAESDYHRQDEQVSNEMMLVDAVLMHLGFKLGVSLL